MAEIWKPVVGYEGQYEVSDHGRVRSVARVVLRKNGSPYRVAPKVLSTHAHEGGYPRVGLRGGGRSRLVYVHRAVLEAFVGPAPEGLLCCHGDGDPTNNALSNLRWDTQAANVADMVSHGRAWWERGVSNG